MYCSNSTGNTLWSGSWVWFPEKAKDTICNSNANKLKKANKQQKHPSDGCQQCLSLVVTQKRQRNKLEKNNRGWTDILSTVSEVLHFSCRRKRTETEVEKGEEKCMSEGAPWPSQQCLNTFDWMLKQSLHLLRCRLDKFKLQRLRLSRGNKLKAAKQKIFQKNKEEHWVSLEAIRDTVYAAKSKARTYQRKPRPRQHTFNIHSSCLQDDLDSSLCVCVCACIFVHLDS